MRKHYLILAVLISAISAVLVFVFLNVQLTPARASTQAPPIDRLLRIMFAIASVILTIVLVTLVYNLAVFRRRRGDTADGPPIRGLTPLEIVWTLIPLVIVIWLAFQGASVLRNISKAPPAGEEELVVKVVAFQWAWRFEYPGYGIISPELRLPVNRPVRFDITSLDVVHSFWVPEWRVKQDAVPGKTFSLRVTPDEVGAYQVLCAELCGQGHAQMKARVYVTEAADFDKWVTEQKK